PAGWGRVPGPVGRALPREREELREPVELLGRVPAGPVVRVGSVPRWVRGSGRPRRWRSVRGC
ncbi:hypothetical protein, partial [Streptomyces sp. NRRL B-11253]|uniref:hypothetical protein n=1 Tax=Streptomyces sp. NRRL B-11253 TaxID=1463826 RepID=UPI001F46498F